MPLWTPADATTALWLDSADDSTLTIVSGAVSQWNDKSGNGRNFAQGTAGNRPDHTPGGPLAFDGTKFLTSQASAATWNFLHNGTVYSIFAVVRYGNTSNPLTSYVFLGTNGGTASKVGTSFGYDDRAALSASDSALVQVGRGGSSNQRVVWYHNDSNAVFSAFNNVFAANTAILASFFLDPGNGTHALRAKVASNGGSAVGNQTYSNAPVSSNAAHTLQIGANGDGGGRLTGNVWEIVIHAGAFDNALHRKIEGYLAHKWGLASNLPEDHPYKSGAPAKLNISGVVTDVAGLSAERTVRVYNRSTGALVADTLSDAGTGEYIVEFEAPVGYEYQRIVLDDDSSPLYNDLIDRVIPE